LSARMTERLDNTTIALPPAREAGSAGFAHGARALAGRAGAASDTLTGTPG
jgi:hypothetical protein